MDKDKLWKLIDAYVQADGLVTWNDALNDAGSGRIDYDELEVIRAERDQALLALREFISHD